MFTIHCIFTVYILYTIYTQGHYAAKLLFICSYSNVRNYRLQLTNVDIDIDSMYSMNEKKNETAAQRQEKKKKPTKM